MSCAEGSKHHMYIFAPKSVRTKKEPAIMSSVAAMEQATLGQYFSTRKKGLEDFHPAKRRKVDATDIESEVSIRRSTRAKRQVASSQTKSNARARRGAKSRAKESLNERNCESSGILDNIVVSETTSLCDDHAFAEALIGKLSDAQRKRKMASKGIIETDDFTASVSRDKKEAQENNRKVNPEQRNRKRTQRSSKKQPKDIISKEEKLVSSQSKTDRSQDQTSRDADIPANKEAEIQASPCKTPPIVRRIDGGVKSNPWIAEQARMVLSRGRAAVNMTQQGKRKSKDCVQITSTNESNSVRSSKTGGNASKVEEDLAKARKLIKSMRSLEKSASKSSQSTIEDNKERLHQVAKEVPAYERFHALAQPSPTVVLPATLPLPYKYKSLAEMFRCTDTVLNLLGQRKEKCTFSKLRDAVQQMSRKKYEKKHLAQMESVYPSALEFCQDKCPGKSSSFELTIEFGKTEEANKKLTLTATELLARKGAFEKCLLKLTKKHHQDFLQNLNPAVVVDDEKIMRWHPKFRLDEVPDVDETALPQPPVVKTYSSAHDVLEKARVMMAPRVEKALRTVAKEQDEKELKNTNKNSNLPEDKEAKTKENTQNKNNSKNNSALKGISQDLLYKIRQKEAKKIEECMMRDPLVDKKLAMKERLPDLCRILKAYFVTERKAAIPLEDATAKLSESYKTSLSQAQVEEHIRFMSQLVPEWISVLTVRKCAYVKINKTADVNNVINKLITKDVH